MKQHPIPQHISSYQFRLIGEMTLKQFLELGGGIIVAWIFYSFKIPPIFKWPIVLGAAFTGIALAFLPIEERPLDQWIMNFFKSIFSPTQYVWKKRPQIPEILKIKKLYTSPPSLPQEPVSQDKTKLKEYLASLSGQKPAPLLEEKQLNHLQKISQLWETPVGVPPMPTLPPSPLPQLKTKPIIEAAPPLSPPILVESRFPHKLEPAVAAQFSTTLPIPTTPDAANVVVGMVLTDMEKIVPNALVEIVDKAGETVRALKTNKLGQFFSGLPLKNGSYQIKVEHPDYEFDVIEFKAENKIILPLKVKAKKIKAN